MGGESGKHIFVMLGVARREGLNEIAKFQGRTVADIIRSLVDGYLVLNGMEPGEPVRHPAPPARRRKAPS